MLVAHPEPFELVQPGEGPLDHPPDGNQPGAVRGAAAGDGRHDPARAQVAAVTEVVVATVGVQAAGLAPRPTAHAADGRDFVQQRQKLCDVVAVAAGHRDRQRSTVRIDDQVVLGAEPAAVDP